MLAKLQTQALAGRSTPLADFAERLQRDPHAGRAARLLWADRLDGNDKALEVFAELAFDLAPTPAARARAVELFRRVYINNGVTTALDLAIALTEDDGRRLGIADEILELLTKAGNRGEGAAIRLKARLTGEAAAIYDEFAEVIAARGDFLALMFAIPHVAPERAEDYIDRAVSLMNCTTKDVEELGDARAILGAPMLSYHWRRVGLAMEGGHVLAKLRLSDEQRALYGKGAAPDARDVEIRALEDGDATARRSLYRLAADPDAPGFDPDAAADHLLAVLQSGTAADLRWSLGRYRAAPPGVRAALADRIGIRDLYRAAARLGDAVAARDYALVLRDTAEGPADLREAANWLSQAAEGGDVTAMAELGRMLATGLGAPPDRAAALGWLEKAARAGNPQAREMARLLRLEVTQ